MLITGIEVRMEKEEAKSAHARPDTEVTVTLTYVASPGEAQRLGRLLGPAGAKPAAAFWEALDWGRVP